MELSYTERSGGSDIRIFCIVSVIDPPSNGGVPDNISCSTTPDENKSPLASTVFPNICSGLM